MEVIMMILGMIWLLIRCSIRIIEIQIPGLIVIGIMVIMHGVIYQVSGISIYREYEKMIGVYRKMREKMNLKIQYYKGLPLRLIDRNYANYKAKRYVINETNQNVWIPNIHLEEDGTIKENEDIDYVFTKSKNQLRYAGYEIIFCKI